MEEGSDRKAVVYLVGAGASHACVKYVNSNHGILMGDLNLPLAQEVRKQVTEHEDDNEQLLSLINAVIDDSTDFEHVITFLDESPSALHRRVANRLREAFEKVLRQKLDSIRTEIGDDRLKLYSALLDMHTIQGFPEKLKGILTINYDEYIEDAIRKTYGTSIDFGVGVDNQAGADGGLKLLKLHGSFGWADKWPISVFEGSSTLWIPPGILKRKDRYPFNVLWGLAREVLDCDILRIVGCRLSSSDWDLISLLFTTRHANARGQRYEVEVIDSPAHAANLQKQYPYLEIKSLLEIENYEVGSQIVGELLGSGPQEYRSLSLEKQEEILERSRGQRTNWFELWLVQMAEALSVEPSVKSIATPTGAFAKLLH